MFIFHTWEFKGITKMMIVKRVWNSFQLYSEIFEKWNLKKSHENSITTFNESIAQNQCKYVCNYRNAELIPCCINNWAIPDAF